MNSMTGGDGPMRLEVPVFLPGFGVSPETARGLEEIAAMEGIPWAAVARRALEDYCSGFLGYIASLEGPDGGPVPVA
jgi:hypothetical protein